MNNKWQCEVIVANGQRFDVEYISTHMGKADTTQPINIIMSIDFCGYPLFIGKMREKEIWLEIEAAVKNNAYNNWETFWDKWELQQAPTLSRQDKITISEENAKTLHY